MDLSQLSPSIAAALKTNPALVELARVESGTLPHHTTREAWDIAHVDPFADVPSTPPRPVSLPSPPKDVPMHGEIKATIVQMSKDEELAQRAHFAASALWAESLSPVDAPDAVTHALSRIDALEERCKRYRMATGLSREMRMKRIKLNNEGVHKTYRFPKQLVEKIAEAAVTRGEKESDTVRFLIECGLILLDERARRYEVFMLEHLQRLDPMDYKEINIGRYVQSDRSNFKHSLMALDPLWGAPTSIRKALSA